MIIILLTLVINYLHVYFPYTTLGIILISFVSVFDDVQSTCASSYSGSSLSLADSTPLEVPVP